MIFKQTNQYLKLKRNTSAQNLDVMRAFNGLLGLPAI